MSSNRKVKQVIGQSSLSSLQNHKVQSVQEAAATSNPVKSGGKKSLHGENAIEKLFDEIMEGIQDKPPNTVLEDILHQVFDTSQTILWTYLPNINALYSPTFSVTVPLTQSFLLTGLRSRVPIAVHNQSQHPSFVLAVDTKVLPPNSPVMMIPIMSRDFAPIAVIQLTRRNENPFSTIDLQNATKLTKKFTNYSSFIFDSPQILKSSYSCVQIESLQNTINNICAAVTKLMRCRKAEIWLFRRRKNIFLKFDTISAEEIPVSEAKTGIAGYVLTTCSTVSERNVCDNANYNPTSDGFYPEAFLGVPFVEKTKRVWCVVCRGRSSPPYFTPNDTAKLTAISSFVVQSVSSAFLPEKVDSQKQNFQERLHALLEVAEALSGILVIDQLIPMIMEKSCSLLNAERCSLFLVDVVKKELKTFFHGGLANAIRIPLTSGIAGKTATTGETINIQDAYNDVNFDRSIDAKTGYRTKSILATPIYNNRGEIIGVTEMINKCNDGIFDEEDIRLLIGFNVFCGISLDNAKLYEASLNLARQVRSFVDISTSLNQSNALRNTLTDILTNAMAAINGTGATLYRVDKEKAIIELVHVGGPAKYGELFAKEVADLGQPKIYTADQIAEKLQSLNLQNAVEEMLGNTEAAAKLENQASRVRRSVLFGSDSAICEQICCLPLINSEGEVIGVMLLMSIQRMMNEDMSLLDCFAIFAAVSLERSELKDIAKLGSIEFELKEWVADNERELTNQIPVKLQLPIEESSKLWIVSFDAPKWAGIGFFKEVFAIFARFKFQENYGISNEKLFRFLCELRDTYNKVPYHNWRHACDVTQFVTYEIILSGAEKILSNMELFALIVAALCHDANHDGFTNVFNEKAETPLGILFKNQSVMETHHCEVAIGIISKEETNLFAKLKSQDFKFMWTTIIELILATDMSKHFTLLKEFKALNDEGKWDKTQPDIRLRMMKLLLKTADISNVSRPFELADRWCDVLCEEFFRQGDLEMASGMQYTSDLNDREHLDKPKSQIGFYTFVCLPLYQATAQAFPPLEVNVQQVQSNLAVWKAAFEKKQAEAAAANPPPANNPPSANNAQPANNAEKK
ncbi:3'5'-cyclic nucleotide phosphodiesterase family protein [Trichomonas vaginalis G3]|uniref:3'5'-cyclic nucleotide phosphodiesterase family protein n=1 Tax=Trichomonas vaginalis (strain ATCC PRA-98 / G3) TaxID=412133 RepID=A2F408_TRIV3|nr:cyclic nucleotide phosphodiesterase family [Trichomonas vaginalis G3]EAY00362.1 3'5'-cyclic nucleotide phosphodiesterase family protein [Trichomonas vaginalis G3]KAI5552347.1 cyclic nucleotide phosphodiesterase family [Trichomonas vaginalis G3]|eukprot:XP_001313291.1 3'5'-cyclic nucleotide phosphodiesterase family protein [Trichomonas vaginalis G3]